MLLIYTYCYRVGGCGLKYTYLYKLLYFHRILINNNTFVVHNIGINHIIALVSNVKYDIYITLMSNDFIGINERVSKS